MNKRLLVTLAVALLVGCSEDEESPATPETDSGIEDTGTIPTDSGVDTTIEDTTIEDTTVPADTTVEETAADTAPESGGDAVTDATDASDAAAADAADASDAADVADTADATPPPQIKCGSTTCNPATQVCCGGVTGGATCASATDAGTCDVRFECSSSDTCGPGMKCCAVVSTSSSGSLCRTSCSGFEIQLCDSNDECPATGDAGTADASDGGDADAAPATGTCAPLTGLGAATGYSRCQ